MTSFLSCETDYMVYTRGPSDDYDRFAELAGDDGWNWDNLFPYAIKVWHLPPCARVFDADTSD